MKTLYIIGGPMGVGKTTVCRLLQKELDNSVLLDGDWCWDANPFQVTEETQKMVINNICYMLNNFLQCTAYDHVIFCWVMHEQGIIDDIMGRLDTADCCVKKISLLCNVPALRERLEKDIRQGIRTEDAVARSIARLPLYQRLDTRKIDTSNRSLQDIVNRIIAIPAERTCPMEIRSLTPGDDRLAISHIYEESWKYAYKGIIPQSYLDGIPAGQWAPGLDKEGMHTLLLLRDGVPVGTSSYCASRFPQFGECGEIVSIYLLPEYMGKGYGRQLLEAMIRELKRLGFQDIFLWVLEDNLRARQFYEKMGFAPGNDYLEDNIGGKKLREIPYCMSL